LGGLVLVSSIGTAESSSHHPVLHSAKGLH
jgi:hypothetical protein